MKSYIVAGMGFGDEGKGSIVDFLSYNTGIKNTIRYNGGHQAAHHVIRNGIMHCFSQFGSSMFSPDTKTILSKYMLIEPFALKNEADVLMKNGIDNPYSRLFIDDECLVVTPMHKILNQMKELVSHNGSCGLGIGETILDSQRFGKYSIRVNDIANVKLLSQRMNFIWRIKVDQAEQILELDLKNEELKKRYNIIKNFDIESISQEYCDIFDKIYVGGNIGKFFSEISIYEGAQGVLLDPKHGFSPYVTKTITTFENAENLCKTPYEKIGVFRPYITRHGNGPLVTENCALGKLIPDIHNGYNQWQGNFRIGWQDLLLMKYAVSVSKPDYIAITNIDRISRMKKIKICVAYKLDFGKVYEYSNSNQNINAVLNDCKPIYKTFYNYKDYFKFIESEEGIDIPIKIMSFGAEATDKVFI